MAHGCSSPSVYDADAYPVLLGGIDYPWSVTQWRYRYADRLLRPGGAEGGHADQQYYSAPNGLLDFHANLPREPNLNQTGLRPEPARALPGRFRLSAKSRKQSVQGVERPEPVRNHRKILYPVETGRA